MATIQDERFCKVHTALGDDLALLGSFQGVEGISRLFQFELKLGSYKTDITAKDLLGTNISLEITLDDGPTRWIHGFVSRFRLATTSTMELAEDGSHRLLGQYLVEIVPWTWFLTRRQDCRIFQEKSVPDIVKEVFDGLGFTAFDFKLAGSYDPLVNCVQYQETDFNFVSRLLESEGISYYFRHDESKHVMILTDANSGMADLPGNSSVTYKDQLDVEDRLFEIHSWEVEEVFQPGHYAMAEYNFMDPTTELNVDAVSTLGQTGADKYEVFEYPGEFLHQGSESETKLSKGDKKVKLRMLEGAARAVVAKGASANPAMAAGHAFTLENHPRDDCNDIWVVTSVTHHLVQVDLDNIGGQVDASYTNNLSCIPKLVDFLPPRVTPQPRIRGPQTAVVVGPSGEEIYVDEFGRVKVQFFWDRYGQSDENSSCWVRVAQNWAGKQWGILFHPRLGQEVVVEFLDGDPDHPLITGRVYNANQSLPFERPTQSGILTRSTKDGNTETFNQILFDDLKGEEKVQINAEKDMIRLVENNDTEDVGASQTSTVGKSKSVTVGEDHQESIGKTMSLSVGADRAVTVSGNLSESVQGKQETTVTKNYTESVGAARSVSVAKGNTTSVGDSDSTTVGASSTLQVSEDRKVDVGKGLTFTIAKNTSFTTGEGFVIKAKKVAIEAKDELHIKVGKAELILKKNGDINLKGGKINIKGTGDVVVKGSKIAQN
jgi:type VI secretion system secreted protein VgrG